MPRPPLRGTSTQGRHRPPCPGWGAGVGRGRAARPPPPFPPPRHRRTRSVGLDLGPLWRVNVRQDEGRRMAAEQLPYLETFALAAELGNFTAAARALGLTQAAVSQRVHALEQELGV